MTIPDRRAQEAPPAAWPEWLDCRIAASALDAFEEVKRGGFAMVYRAGLEGRHVAVKVLHSEEATPCALFVQEAAVLRMLRHRGIVEFLGVCTIPKGHPCVPEAEDKPRLAIVEEYLEGGRLKNFMIRGSTMGPSYFYTVLDIMIQVAEAVEYLHSFRPKVLHRDITPDNIIITRRGSKLQAKLVDFGLVALIGDANKNLPKLNVGRLGYLHAFSATHPPHQANSDAPQRHRSISVSSMDSWRICANSREQDQSVEQLVPSLSRNPYEGPRAQHMPWASGNDMERDVDGKWWTEARSRVRRRVLGLGRRVSDVGRRGESAASDVVQRSRSQSSELSRVSVSPLLNGCDGPGNSRREGLHLVALTGQTGSFMYMAPEIFQRKPYCETVDAFSFGTILFEVFSGALLLVSHTDVGSPRATVTYAHRVALGYRPALPKQFPCELSRIIAACWMADGLERPLFQEIVGALKEIRSKGVIRNLARRRMNFLQRLCGTGGRQLEYDCGVGCHSF